MRQREEKGLVRPAGERRRECWLGKAKRERAKARQGKERKRSRRLGEAKEDREKEGWLDEVERQ